MLKTGGIWDIELFVHSLTDTVSHGYLLQT